MKTIKINDTGVYVELATRILMSCGFICSVKNKFDESVNKSVCSFQKSKNLKPDGIVGPKTWGAMSNYWPNLGNHVWRRVPAHVYGNGYSMHRIRDDLSVDYMNVFNSLDSMGGKLTSSGSKRSLNAKVSKSRSATSLHYIGRAIDLNVYSGMHDLKKEPYLIEKEGRYWRVWARVKSGGEERCINAWHHPSWSSKKVEANVIDLTELMKENNFERIPHRKLYNSKRKSYGSSEWWHFQNTSGLVEDETLFGDELLKMYTINEVKNTPPWKYRMGLWKKDWQ